MASLLKHFTTLVVINLCACSSTNKQFACATLASPASSLSFALKSTRCRMIGFRFTGTGRWSMCDVHDRTNSVAWRWLPCCKSISTSCRPGAINMEILFNHESSETKLIVLLCLWVGFFNPGAFQLLRYRVARSQGRPHQFGEAMVQSMVRPARALETRRDITSSRRHSGKVNGCGNSNNMRNEIEGPNL